MTRMPYQDIVTLRKALCVPNAYKNRYKTLEDCGLDGPWVTPLQRTSYNDTGPVLIAQDYLDTERARQNRPAILAPDGDGYCPGTRFKTVLTGALEIAELCLHQVYVTQALHLLPCKWFLARDGTCRQWKGGRHPMSLVLKSFNEVTRHELCDRPVIAMGKVAQAACDKAGVKPDKRTSHPSRRGSSNEWKLEIGNAIREVLGRPRVY